MLQEVSMLEKAHRSVLGLTRKKCILEAARYGQIFGHLEVLEDAEFLTFRSIVFSGREKIFSTRPEWYDEKGETVSPFLIWVE